MGLNVESHKYILISRLIQLFVYFVRRIYVGGIDTNLSPFLFFQNQNLVIITIKHTLTRETTAYRYYDYDYKNIKRVCCQINNKSIFEHPTFNFQQPILAQVTNNCLSINVCKCI